MHIYPFINTRFCPYRPQTDLPWWQQCLPNPNALLRSLLLPQHPKSKSVLAPKPVVITTAKFSIRVTWSGPLGLSGPRRNISQTPRKLLLCCAIILIPWHFILQPTRALNISSVNLISSWFPYLRAPPRSHHYPFWGWAHPRRHSANYNNIKRILHYVHKGGSKSKEITTLQHYGSLAYVAVKTSSK